MGYVLKKGALIMTLNLRNILLVGFLVIEALIFGIVYLFGTYGVQQLKVAKKDYELFVQEVNILKQDVEKLEKQLQAWQSDDFYKEQIARERLHLSKPNEHIYHLD
jgi:cell division protein FtsB